MGVKNHPFDDEVRKSFSDFEVAPSPGVWSSIASHLASYNKTRRLIPIWARVAAGIAIILGTTITAWLVFDPKNLNREETLTPKVGLNEFENNTLSVDEEKALARIDTVNLGKNIKLFGFSKPILTVKALNEPTSQSLQAIERKSLQPLDFLRSNVLISQKPLRHNNQFQVQAIHHQTMAEELAANYPKTSEVNGDFSAGIYFSPQFSFRSLDNSFLPAPPFNGLEKPLLTYSFGAYARFKVVERVGVQIGFEYSSMGQFLNHITSVLHQPHFPSFTVNPMTKSGHPQTLLTSFGHIAFTTESLVFVDLMGSRIKSNFDFYSSNNLKRMAKDDLGLTQQLTFLDFPVLLDLKLLKIGNSGISLKGGGGLGYLLHNQVFIGKGAFSSSIGETQGLSKFSFFYSGSLKIDYKIKNALRFSIEPSIRRYIRAMFEESPLFAPASPFKYSITTGVTIDF